MAANTRGVAGALTRTALSSYVFPPRGERSERSMLFSTYGAKANTGRPKRGLSSGSASLTLVTLLSADEGRCGDEGRGGGEGSGEDRGSGEGMKPAVAGRAWLCSLLGELTTRAELGRGGSVHQRRV